METRRLILAVLLSLLALWPQAARAEAAILDNLAGAWNDLDGFASVGQCISSPANSAHVCSPTHLARSQKGRFEGRGTISATDSVLAVSDRIRKNEISSADVNALFSEYNYTDLLLNVDLNYVTKGFLVGIRPVRYQGQFEVHNPNLPLVSLAFREDQDIHAGTAVAFGGDLFRFTAGATGSLLFREETLVEASLVDLASRPARDLLDKQKMTGYFFDIGATAEIRESVMFSVLAKDVGDWMGNRRTNVNRYLFLNNDKLTKLFFSLAALPRLWGGRLQVGVSTVRFLEANNQFDKQWFTTLSYYLGPLRVLTGWRPDLFRTGVAMRFGRFEVNVAQEWLNNLESGRKAQPRFTLEVTSGL